MSKEQTGTYKAESRITRKIESAISSSKTAAAAAEKMLDDQSDYTEQFIVLALNNKNELIGSSTVAKGGMSECGIYMPTIFRFLLEKNAYRFIVTHNHPSGIVKSSPEDLHLTRQIVKCGKLMGIHLLDSLILAKNGDYLSIRDSGKVKF